MSTVLKLQSPGLSICSETPCCSILSADLPPKAAVLHLPGGPVRGGGGILV